MLCRVTKARLCIYSGITTESILDHRRAQHSDMSAVVPTKGAACSSWNALDLVFFQGPPLGGSVTVFRSPLDTSAVCDTECSYLPRLHWEPVAAQAERLLKEEKRRQSGGKSSRCTEAASPFQLRAKTGFKFVQWHFWNKNHVKLAPNKTLTIYIKKYLSQTTKLWHKLTTKNGSCHTHTRTFTHSCRKKQDFAAKRMLVEELADNCGMWHCLAEAVTPHVSPALRGCSLCLA